MFSSGVDIINASPTLFTLPWTDGERLKEIAHLLIRTRIKAIESDNTNLKLRCAYVENR